MKRPALSLRTQGWLLIAGLLAVFIMTMAPRVERIVSVKSETKFLSERIQKVKSRLDDLPAINLQTGEARNEVNLAAQIQQTLSNTIRSNGARLTALAGQGRIETPISALAWQAGLEGDVLAVQETLAALDNIESLYIETLSITPIRNSGQMLTVQLNITTPLQLMPNDSPKDTAVLELVSKNPFNPDRTRFVRGANTPPAPTQIEFQPVLLGLRKKNGEWLASVQLQDRELPKTLSVGDDTQLGRITDISGSGVTILSDQGTEQILRSPFD